jgi:hypothetical protein
MDIMGQVMLMRPAAAGALLDPYTTGLTGAWSLSRNLLTSFVSARYSDTSGAINSVTNQAGPNLTLSNTSTLRPTLATGGASGRACADFDGVNDSLKTTGAAGHQLANLITNSNGWIAVSCIVDVIDANNATVYANDCVIGDSGGFMGLFLKTLNGLHVYNFDTNVDTTSTTIATATPYVLEWRHEGGTVYCRVNGGTEVSVASGNTGTMTGRFCIGSTQVVEDGTRQLNGQVFDIVAYNATPAVGNRNIIVANMLAWIS